MTESAPARSASWKWWVCALLLGASAINYMDRQTLANAAVRITREFQLSQEQYGNLELAFGWAFAVGSLVFGWLADRLPLRWLYPAVLMLWSLVGFSTGFAHSYSGLLVCRSLLGFFEAGHWPLRDQDHSAIARCERPHDGKRSPAEWRFGRGDHHAVAHELVDDERNGELAFFVPSHRCWRSGLDLSMAGINSAG
jgi:hypothetical protein